MQLSVQKWNARVHPLCNPAARSHLQSSVHACIHAESIAFYKGEKHEERCASLRLVLLVAVVRIKIVWATFLALWTNFYQHATLLLPSLLTAPRYFAGEVEFGVITQVRSTAQTCGKLWSIYVFRYLSSILRLSMQLACMQCICKKGCLWTLLLPCMTLMPYSDIPAGQLCIWAN